MNMKQVITNYYKDYIDTHFLTLSEFEELTLLFQIIYKDKFLGRDQLFNDLNELRMEIGHESLRLIDLRFDNINHETYLDVLRSRELTGDQRTNEWKMQRHKYITASVSAACAGLMGPASREYQLLEKASYGKYSSFKGGYYTDIGNIFEPITNNHYSYINNTRIHDYSLIPNDKHPWTFLAASTDGVAQRSTELTNIEIKTLPGRIPNGKVKKEYYHQMQHQMECLGLSHSDFIEVKYEQVKELPINSTKPIGIIAELYHETDGYFYEYSPAGASYNDVKDWQQSRESVIIDYNDKIFIRWIYWVQTHYSCIRVEKDPKWIVTMGPLLQKFYDELQELWKNPKEVQRRINEKEQKTFNKKNVFTECLI